MLDTGRLIHRTRRWSASTPVKKMELADTPQYQRLRAQMEDEWVAQMQEVLAIETTELPVIWDADFLYGPKNEVGDDSYVLCEVNLSAVFPYPPQATRTLALAATARRTERSSSA